MSEALNRERDEELARLLGISVEDFAPQEDEPEEDVDPFEPRSSLSRAGTRHSYKRSNVPYRKYDWDEMVADFDLGMAPFDIAKKYGCKYDTVYKALDHFKRKYPDRKPGKPQAETCKRGHPMVEGNAIPMKAGGRYCRKCRCERKN